MRRLRQRGRKGGDSKTEVVESDSDDNDSDVKSATDSKPDTATAASPHLKRRNITISRTPPGTTRCTARVVLRWGHLLLRRGKGGKRSVYDTDSPKLFRVQTVETCHVGHVRATNDKAVPAHLSTEQKNEIGKLLGLGLAKAGDLEDRHNFDGTGSFFSYQARYLKKKWLQTKMSESVVVKPQSSKQTETQQMLTWLRQLPGVCTYLQSVASHVARIVLLRSIAVA